MNVPISIKFYISGSRNREEAYIKLNRYAEFTSKYIKYLYRCYCHNLPSIIKWVKKRWKK